MKFAAIFSLLLSAPCFAANAEFTATDLLNATQTAVQAFVQANPDHAQHLSGFKTWKSGIDANVKIFAMHGGAKMEFNYICIRSGDQIRCNAN